MRDLAHLRAFGSLGLDKVLEKLLGEHTACGEIVVICFKTVKRLGKACGQTLQLCLFLLGKVEEVEIVGTPAFGMRIAA